MFFSHSRYSILLCTILLLSFTGCAFLSGGKDFTPVSPAPDHLSVEVISKPTYAGRVTDLVPLLSKVETDTLTHFLDSLANLEIADYHVLMVPSLGDASPKDYSAEVLQDWSGSGQLSDLAFLMVISAYDGQVAFGLAPAIADSLSPRVADFLFKRSASEAFDNGHFKQGIVDFVEQTVLMLIDQSPQPANGYQDLMNALDYPEREREEGVQDIVYMRVLVGASGTVLDCVPVEEVEHEAFVVAADEAIREVFWRPAMHKGQSFSMWITVPVVFRLGYR